MADRQAPALPGAATGAAARALAARLARHGYEVSFPPGRDPAVFKVTGLPGGPYVEVTAEDNGRPPATTPAAARPRPPGSSPGSRFPAAPGRVPPDTVTATWDGIEIEWHYQPPHGQPADPRQMTAALLAHLAVLGGDHDRKDDPT